MQGVIAVSDHAFICLRDACRKAKRKRYTDLFLMETAVQWLNLVAYITPNIYLLCNTYAFDSSVVFWCGWVRWTCWNTVSHHILTSTCSLAMSHLIGRFYSTVQWVHPKADVENRWHPNCAPVRLEVSQCSEICALLEPACVFLPLPTS